LALEPETDCGDIVAATVGEGDRQHPRPKRRIGGFWHAGGGGYAIRLLAAIGGCARKRKDGQRKGRQQEKATVPSESACSHGDQRRESQRHKASRYYGIDTAQY
jgi:hypothetical protein